MAADPFNDVFVSYRRLDAQRVVPFVESLRRRGLAVWLDRDAIGDFEPITERIRAGLAGSRCLVAWYSKDYPASRPCQMELTGACLAAQAGGELLTRVLVVNPEPDGSHILPAALADAVYASADLGPEALAERVAAAVARVDGPLGRLLAQRPGRQFGRALMASPQFVGRQRELWQLHALLSAPDTAIISGAWGPTPVQVIGMPGVGKSLFAEEYAVRYATAYPAGVFWMRASLGNAADTRRGLAAELGLPVARLDAGKVRAALAEHLAGLPGRFLWVVDDVGPGLDDAALRDWFAPAPQGVTLLTTATEDYARVGQALRLASLDAASATAMLAARRPPQDDADRRALADIADILGGHPLALEVASAGLEAEQGLRSIAEFRDALADPSRDELELAVGLVGLLPTGHEASVAATLARALARLGPEGHDLIGLAAGLATAPIPVDLVRDTIAAVDRLDAPAALQRTRQALNQVQVASLMSVPSSETRSVHGLVARAARLDASRAARREALAAAARTVLVDRLQVVDDARQHVRLRWHVAHARHLLSSAAPLDPVAVMLRGLVARFDHERGDYPAAEAGYRRQAEESETLSGPDARLTLQALGHRARALGYGQLNEALALALERHVLERRRAVFGEEDLDTITAMNNLAIRLKVAHQFDEAVALQRRVLDLRLRLLGPMHEHTLFAKNNLGATLSGLGQVDEGMQLVREAVEGRRAVLGPDHADTLTATKNLAAQLVDLGRLDEALPLLQEVVDARRRVLGVDHPNTLAAETTLGLVYIRLERPAEARDLLVGTLERCIARQGATHADTLLLQNNLARAWFKLGDFERARPLQENAYRGGLANPATTPGLATRYGINLLELALRSGDESAARTLRTELSWLDMPTAAPAGIPPKDLDELRRLWGALPASPG